MKTATRPSQPGILSLFTLAALAATGCGVNPSNTILTSSSPSLRIAGLVRGGQQPVAGATIQLYAANPNASKGASAALIPGTVLTDANGNFTITGDYTCPSSGSLVYLVATGGNSGLPGVVNNTDLAEMALLGTCGSLNASTSISVNELTTVASVEALAPFMADYAHVGNDPANPIGLQGAFQTSASLVNFSTGQFQSTTTGITLPAALLNTLANILASCVNSPGGAAGSTSSCGTLLSSSGSGTASDTVGAMLGIVRSPATNVSSLFGLGTAVAPFQPALAAAPTDFAAPTTIALPLSQTYGPEFRLMAIDTAQHVWVATPNQTGATTYITGPINVFDNNGGPLFTVQPGAGGLYLPVQMAADPFGNMWALNSNATVSKFDPNGNALSPAAGFPVPFNFSTSVYSNTSYPHELGLNYMSIDTLGNVWGIGSGSTSNCFIELNNAGTVITPAGTFCGSAINALVAAVTTDLSGNAWYAGTGSVSKVNSSGNLVTTGVNTNGCFSDNLATAVTVENSTQNLFWDGVNSRLWGVGDVSVGVLNPDGTQLFCDAAGANLPVVPLTSASVVTTGNLVVSSATLDGGGNLWFTTTNTPTGNAPTSTTKSGLNGISPTGQLLTPFNPSTGVFGLQYLSAQVVGENANLGEEIATDAYGDLWYISGNSLLVKIPGLAIPKNR